MEDPNVQTAIKKPKSIRKALGWVWMASFLGAGIAFAEKAYMIGWVLAIVTVAGLTFMILTSGKTKKGRP